ncbi:hypothetical protein ACFWJT_08025 [Streptomyces sp. NPDC127069]|uniref:hypothetical protein n=1 Tax=Streptomyces sp. NPDC127069 TaxID=3347128 RepID=UPI00364B10BE
MGAGAGAGAGPAAPVVVGTPRTPGLRGMEIAVPAQVWAGDPVLAELTATVPATSVVILNPGNGGAPFGSSWCARADARRAGTTVTGERPKVLGCLHTDHGHGLRTPDGRLHVDGVFFDVVSRDCGPGHVIRDQPGPRRPRRPPSPSRGAGYAYATSAAMPNLRDSAPI